MSDPGLVQTLDTAFQDGMHLANQIAAPIYDAAGAVIGWSAGILAPFIGTSTAVEISDATGQVIGHVANTVTATQAAVLHEAGAVIAPAYDATQKYIGQFVSAAGSAIGTAEDFAKNALKWGGIALFGVVVLYIVVQRLESD